MLARHRRGSNLPRGFPGALRLRTYPSMAAASQGFHEDERSLSSRTKDLHRAIVSLQEELEAIDWYQQRADAAEDPELRAILEHNRDEEKEHASMLLEWLRRNDVALARMVKLHIGRPGPIVTEEEKAEASDEKASAGAAE